MGNRQAATAAAAAASSDFKHFLLARVQSIRYNLSISGISDPGFDAEPLLPNPLFTDYAGHSVHDRTAYLCSRLPEILAVITAYQPAGGIPSHLIGPVRADQVARRRVSAREPTPDGCRTLTLTHAGCAWRAEAQLGRLTDLVAALEGLVVMEETRTEEKMLRPRFENVWSYIEDKPAKAAESAETLRRVVGRLRAGRYLEAFAASGRGTPQIEALDLVAYLADTITWHDHMAGVVAAVREYCCGGGAARHEAAEEVLLAMEEALIEVADARTLKMLESSAVRPVMGDVSPVEEEGRRRTKEVMMNGKGGVNDWGKKKEER